MGEGKEGRREAKTHNNFQTSAPMVCRSLEHWVDLNPPADRVRVRQPHLRQSVECRWKVPAGVVNDSGPDTIALSISSHDYLCIHI